jgi:hypothetical protein
LEDEHDTKEACKREKIDENNGNIAREPEAIWSRSKTGQKTKKGEGKAIDEERFYFTCPR